MCITKIYKNKFSNLLPKLVEQLLPVEVLLIHDFFLVLGERGVDLLLREVEAHQLAPDALLLAHGCHHCPRWWRRLGIDGDPWTFREAKAMGTMLGRAVTSECGIYHRHLLFSRNKSKTVLRIPKAYNRSSVHLVGYTNQMNLFKPISYPQIVL